MTGSVGIGHNEDGTVTPPPSGPGTGGGYDSDAY